MSVAAILRQAIRQVDLPGPLPNELPGGIDVSDVRLRDPVGEIGGSFKSRLAELLALFGEVIALSIAITDAGKPIMKSVHEVGVSRKSCPAVGLYETPSSILLNSG